MNLTLGDIAACLQPAKLIGRPETLFTRVHTDTRSIQAGDLFVAIKGDNFDANSMLPLAGSSGAAAVIAHVAPPVAMAGFTVPDTRAALGQLGSFWRKRFTGPLIAVTGSNGKTTVTQILASILRAHAGAAAHATKNSFNNDIGLPLTLLALNAGHSHAVVEIGMNHVGEINTLAALAMPTVALVNNAQREHQEFMGTVQAVAEENACVFAHTQAGGVAVFPANDAYSSLWAKTAQQHGLTTLRFGPGGDVTGNATWQASSGGGGFLLRIHTPKGELQALLRMPGAHNVHNALAACACAVAAGVPLPAIASGIDAFQAVKGRSHLLALQGRYAPLALIDDSYNANPDSVRAAIDVLASMSGPRWLVLGDMGEVGDLGPAFHAEVGSYAAQRGVDRLVTMGELATHAASAFSAAVGRTAFHATSLAELTTELDNSLPQAGVVLVKGSRFMRMERVVAHIQSMGGPAATESTNAA